jgi:hypothetical protein
MTREKDLKNISLRVTNDCWKKLKILSIQKEISLQEYVKDILEKSITKKTFDEINV